MSVIWEIAWFHSIISILLNYHFFKHRTSNDRNLKLFHPYSRLSTILLVSLNVNSQVHLQVHQ
jgi:hypothetical protein